MVAEILRRGYVNHLIVDAFLGEELKRLFSRGRRVLGGHE
jgi:hypothetical protein